MFLEYVTGIGKVIVFFLACALPALLLRLFIKIPKEVFRKLLHLMLLCSLPVFVYYFETWWVSALAALSFIVFAYPILWLAEKIKGFSQLIVERKSGEIRRSLIIVFIMFAIMVSICWGWLNQRWLVLVCVYAWGFGDGAAALVGKKFGRHSIEGKYVDSKKTLEGTLAMFVVSFFTVLIILLVSGDIVWYGSILIAAITAAVSALVELYTHNGMDTLTCPLAAAAVILPLVYLLGV
jgi:dolichol kinase